MGDCHLSLPVMEILMLVLQGYLQVTYVEPYFDDWELKQRKTVFDRSFNIREYL